MGGQRRNPLPYPDGQDPLETYLALRLRGFRHHRGLTQTQLGTAIGVSFQQIQKYESAQDRMSCATLYRAADALAVPFGAFFEGFGDDALEMLAVDHDAKKLVKVINRIPDPNLRAALIGLVVTLMRDDGDDE